MQSSRKLIVSIKLLAFVSASFIHVVVRAWDIDLSRRTKDIQKVEGPGRLKLNTPKEKSWARGLSQVFESTQDIVVMHTENGFVPETIRLKRGQPYRMHVVNVNSQQKNTSFVLESFSEHHGMYFGQELSFQIAPQQEGVFTFFSPETDKQGRIVVVGESPTRKLATEEGK
jgi:hypothetical protein